MQWKSLLAAAIISASSANAILRFGCSQLVIDRIDPLVNPGVLGTPHVHQVVGGNGFNATMAPGDDISARATCTTCEFSEDFSNYWTAALYFQHPTNGSFKRVPTYQVGGPGKGGFIVYYTQGEFALGQYEGRKVSPFKKGFRMLSGDPSVRTMNNASAEAKSLTFRCFQSNGNPAAPYPGGGVRQNIDFYELPNKPCPGGIRSQVYFPTCWDGKNLDSPDHKSHVAFSDRGKCPSTHPVGIPQVLYEVTWDTAQFNSMWPSGGKNPFVFSQGDRTGYGQHGDYLFGWKGDALDRAMASCDDGFGNAPPARCPTLKNQSGANGNQCTMKGSVVEEVEGWLTSLPGNPTMDKM